MIIRARLRHGDASTDSTVDVKVQTFGSFVPGPRSLQLALGLLGWTQWELVGYEFDKQYTEIDLEGDDA
jgi:hypothetical protein